MLLEKKSFFQLGNQHRLSILHMTRMEKGGIISKKREKRREEKKRKTMTIPQKIDPQQNKNGTLKYIFEFLFMSIHKNSTIFSSKKTGLLKMTVMYTG
jgi:hypothetical protein